MTFCSSTLQHNTPPGAAAEQGVKAPPNVDSLQSRKLSIGCMWPQLSAMPNQPAKNPATTTLSTRVEPELLLKLHQLADRRQVSLCAAARHALAVGMERLQQAA